MWYYFVRWYARWFESDSAIEWMQFASFGCSLYFSSSMNPRYYFFWRFCLDQAVFCSVAMLSIVKKIRQPLFGFLERSINCDVLIGWNCWELGSQKECNVNNGSTFCLWFDDLYFVLIWPSWLTGRYVSTTNTSVPRRTWQINVAAKLITINRSVAGSYSMPTVRGVCTEHWVCIRYQFVFYNHTTTEG